MGLPEHIPPSYLDKLLVPARVMLPGSGPLDGWFALSPATPFREGPESLLELLNSGVRVVPFIRDADDVVVLLSRDTIEWVEVGSEVDPAWVRPGSFIVTREEQVQVCMAGGQEFGGRVSLELPEHLNRVSDFLNQDDDFFPLAIERGTLLINKARLACLRLFESSPPPASEGA